MTRKSNAERNPGAHRRRGGAHHGRGRHRRFRARQAQGRAAAGRRAIPRRCPGNDEIETELRAYRALYQADEHPQRVAELREVALEAMRALEHFNPYLTGPVLKGIAGPYAEIELQLFPESAKEVEIFLLDRNIVFDTHEDAPLFRRSARAVSVLHPDLAGRPAAACRYSIRATSASRSRHRRPGGSWSAPASPRLARCCAMTPAAA